MFYENIATARVTSLISIVVNNQDNAYLTRSLLLHFLISQPRFFGYSLSLTVSAKQSLVLRIINQILRMKFFIITEKKNMVIELDPLILFIFLIESSAAICSLIINIFLIRLGKLCNSKYIVYLFVQIIVWIRGFRFGNYRYFIYAFAILDCIYSIGNFLSMNVSLFI